MGNTVGRPSKRVHISSLNTRVGGDNLRIEVLKSFIPKKYGIRVDHRRKYHPLVISIYLLSYLVDRVSKKPLIINVYVVYFVTRIPDCTNFTLNGRWYNHNHNSVLKTINKGRKSRSRGLIQSTLEESVTLPPIKQIFTRSRSK